MKNQETPKYGEAALLEQISILQKQLDECLAPIGTQKSKEINPHEMIAKHGGEKAWTSKIDQLYASYDPALLNLIKRFSASIDVKDYIEFLNDSQRALTTSKTWRQWDHETRDLSAYTFHVIMNFLIDLRVILERRRSERDIRGI